MGRSGREPKASEAGTFRREDGHVVAVFNIGVTRTDAAALKQIESKKGRVTNG